MKNSIYWYDYETFGTDPKYDRIAQFGGIRTDEELNIISDPLVIYCKPPNDTLPNPHACLVTGITPQKASKDGLLETDFIARIHNEFSRPGTCIAGFNNIRFDDEFTRYCLYRNFINAYAHEWKNGNSRWDIIDLVRMTRALRPSGINWPVGDDNKPSIRLELLTKANNINHESAHDAMSDVYATINMARLIKNTQPKLYDFMYAMRKKQEVSKLINLRTREPLIHASSRFSSERYSIAVIVPICQHPVNRNSIIVYDLATDPSDYIQVDNEELRNRIYTRASELPAGESRIPLKEVHINKCPALAPINTLDSDTAIKLGINIEDIKRNRKTIIEHIDKLADKTQKVYSISEYPEINDPDAQLYSGGFFSDDDERRMDKIRACTPGELADLQMTFDDSRLPGMLFRYRARNYPGTLNDNEYKSWNEYRHNKFFNDSKDSLSLDQYYSMIETLKSELSADPVKTQVLESLYDYGKQLENEVTDNIR